MSCSKKRRRSSLASSKVKIDMVPIIGQGLHKSIDSTLPQEQRLAQLHKACLEVTVARLKAEFPTEGVTECLDEVLDKVPEILRRDDMREAMYTACHIGSLLPNPDNLEMDAIMEQMQARIQRLRDEEQNWKDYISELDTQAAMAEGMAERQVILEDELSPEQRSLSDKYFPFTTDLNAIRLDVMNNLLKGKLLVRQHEENVNNLTQIQQDLNSRLGASLTDVHERMFTSTGSPRTNIQTLVAFPTPEPEPHI